MKPFDLDRALAGDPVCTRKGELVTDLYYFKNADPLAGPIIYGLINGEILCWYKNGHQYSFRESSFDLFMASRKVTKWVNVYKETIERVKEPYSIGRYDGKEFFDSEEKAKKVLNLYSSCDFLATVPITWEE